MGQAAYLTVSELEEQPSANLYVQLSEQFNNLQQILQAMRGECLQFTPTECPLLSPFKDTLQ